MRRRKIHDQREAVRELRLLGWTVERIASALGLTTRHVRNHLAALRAAAESAEAHRRAAQRLADLLESA